MAQEEQVVKVASMEAFFTRAKANEGEVFPLHLRSGEKTDQWLRLLGVDSDAYLEARAEGQRRLLDEMNLKTEHEKNQAYVAKERRQYGALVSGWSFPQPCTPENVSAFLTEAPHILASIKHYVLVREGFFTEGSATSSSGQSVNSDSEPKATDQSKQSDSQ